MKSPNNSVAVTFIIVAPARGRGLKSGTFHPCAWCGMVAPARGRGLKFPCLRKLRVCRAVAPARGRGLK